MSAIWLDEACAAEAEGGIDGRKGHIPLTPSESNDTEQEKTGINLQSV